MSYLEAEVDVMEQEEEILPEVNVDIEQLRRILENLLVTSHSPDYGDRDDPPGRKMCQ